MARCRHAWEYIDRHEFAKPARVFLLDPTPEPGATTQRGEATVPVEPGDYRDLNITGWCSRCGAIRCRDSLNRKRIFRPTS